jgi:hypothetical protein
MPKAWSNKDDRQFDHVKKSEKKRGRSEETAKEIAARTVNKHRFAEGRTEAKTSRATGNPNTSLEERTRKELYNRARELHIRRRSSMTKAELVAAIRGKS